MRPFQCTYVIPLTLGSVVDDKVIPIWNVMGVIPGHIKDEVVVIGNHRDGRFQSVPAGLGRLMTSQL